MQNEISESLRLKAIEWIGGLKLVLTQKNGGLIEAQYIKKGQIIETSIRKRYSVKKSHWLVTESIRKNDKIYLICKSFTAKPKKQTFGFGLNTLVLMIPAKSHENHARTQPR